MKSAFAYNTYSPKAEKEAPKHLKKWESLTDGNDPSQVDPMFKKTATWNVKDGVQGLPKTSVLDAMKNSERLRSAFDAYMFQGKPLSEATHDEKLNEYYESLAAVVQHPDARLKKKRSTKQGGKWFSDCGIRNS